MWNATGAMTQYLADENLRRAKDPNAESLSLDQSGAASDFAGIGQANYGAMTDRGNAYLDRLEGLASGRDSLATEGLRQGLQQQLAMQRSAVAGAAPQNAAMAARVAANNMGRASSGMAGNAAMAGIAERNAATQALGQGILGMRGQDVQAAIGSRGNAVQALGNVLGKPREPGFWDYATSIAGSGLGALAMSDKRLKDDVKDADSDARRMLDGLKAYTYKYKDEKYGKGKQLGVMAQDVERVLPQAVVETREGKALDAGKLAGGLAAMVSSVHRRVSKLEGKGK